MARCIFCGREQEDFRGTFLIKNEGTVVYYCSSKCKKNHLKLGRDRRKLKWTEAFHEMRQKRMASEKTKKDKLKA